jgi:hypothetical protein
VLLLSLLSCLFSELFYFTRFTVETTSSPMWFTTRVGSFNSNSIDEYILCLTISIKTANPRKKVQNSIYIKLKSRLSVLKFLDSH